MNKQDIERTRYVSIVQKVEPPVDKQIPVEDVTRVVVVRVSGREEHDTKQYHGVAASLHLQDGGRTLKLFIKDHPTVSEEDVTSDIVNGLSQWFSDGGV